MDGASATGSSIIKNLASCNKSTRDKALRLLKTWLPNQPLVSSDDMKLIWKGLFYCVWHSDKAPVQAELIDNLASLLLSLDVPLAVDYYSVFLLTMRREWSGIDVLRLDKFYLLIRRFVLNLFVFMKKHSWDFELSGRLVNVLDAGTFSASDKYQAHGVNYHVATVFLDEIRSFLPLRIEILEMFFKFFMSAMGKTKNKVLLVKIKSNVFDVLLKMGNSLLEVRKSGGEVESGDDVVLFGTIGLLMGFANKFFELGSSPDCLQGNRKVLFSLHHAFLKLEKELSSSGIKVSISEIKDNDEADEVPMLITISKMDEPVADVLVSDPLDVSVIKHSKKKKSDKSSDGSSKKTKKSDKKSTLKNGSVIESKDDGPVSNGDENIMDFNESVISNLQMQFEKIAAESGLDADGLSVCESPKTNAKDGLTKKRKRVKSVDGKKTHKVKGDGGTEGILKSGDKSAKKVKFSMENNLVWKPQTPLPPQSLRLPASATPRGSALKQGIPPGPVRGEVSRLTTNNAKRANYGKKGRKAIKGISPANKRLKKIKTVSMQL